MKSLICFVSIGSHIILIMTIKSTNSTCIHANQTHRGGTAPLVREISARPRPRSLGFFFGIGRKEKHTTCAVAAFVASSIAHLCNACTCRTVAPPLFCHCMRRHFHHGDETAAAASPHCTRQATRPRLQSLQRRRLGQPSKLACRLSRAILPSATILHPCRCALQTRHVPHPMLAHT